MDYSPEEYSRYYIVEALFMLMKEYAYEKISVTDITAKAGVGRATFYRYFKRKEDVIRYYLEHYTKLFVFGQRFYPRCREDYLRIAEDAFSLFKEQKERFKLLRAARLEYIYLDYLNHCFSEMFAREHPELNRYTPYLFAGMLFNVSMAWLDGDCAESVSSLAGAVIEQLSVQ